MKYIEILHKINNNIHLQYYREKVIEINQWEKEEEKSNRKKTIILMIITAIAGLFFRDNIYVLLFFFAIYMTLIVSHIEKRIYFKLNKQTELNDFLIWTIEDLARDKFFKERSDYVDSRFMNIFWDFWKKHDNIYFDEEGQKESIDKYIPASSLKKYIRDKLSNKYSDYYYKDIGKINTFEDIYLDLEKTFIKPRN